MIHGSILPILLCALLCPTGHSRENQRQIESQWSDLIRHKKIDEARKVCSGWLSSESIVRKAEAHKCLANVSMSGAEVLKLEGDDAGGGTISGVEVLKLEGNDAGGGTLSWGYIPEALDEAINHLDLALKLAPQDLSIHQGRLHLLRLGGRYDDMAKALDESCETYKGSDGIEAWIQYTAELFEDKHYKASMELLRVLEKHYPNQPKVIGNMGAVLSVLGEDDEAIKYLRRAVELSPEDPIDTWNLGRLYDFTGKIDLADEWYRKALLLQPDVESRQSQTCLYATFVQNKLKDSPRACELQKASCAAEKRSACESPEEPEDK